MDFLLILLALAFLSFVGYKVYTNVKSKNKVEGPKAPVPGPYNYGPKVEDLVPKPKKPKTEKPNTLEP